MEAVGMKKKEELKMCKIINMVYFWYYGPCHLLFSTSTFRYFSRYFLIPGVGKLYYGHTSGPWPDVF